VLSKKYKWIPFMQVSQLPELNRKCRNGKIHLIKIRHQNFLWKKRLKNPCFPQAKKYYRLEMIFFIVYKTIIMSFWIHFMNWLQLFIPIAYFLKNWNRTEVYLELGRKKTEIRGKSLMSKKKVWYQPKSLTILMPER